MKAKPASAQHKPSSPKKSAGRNGNGNGNGVDGNGNGRR